MPTSFKKSTITCIKCGYKKEEVMPQYASKTTYTCTNCKNTITPTKCCVFCSYGSVPCPPSQRKNLGSFNTPRTFPGLIKVLNFFIVILSRINTKIILSLLAIYLISTMRNSL